MEILKEPWDDTSKLKALCLHAEAGPGVRGHASTLTPIDTSKSHFLLKVLWSVVPEVVRDVVAFQQTKHQDQVDSGLELTLQVIDDYLQLFKHLTTKLAEGLNGVSGVCVSEDR